LFCAKVYLLTTAGGIGGFLYSTPLPTLFEILWAIKKIFVTHSNGILALGILEAFIAKDFMKKHKTSARLVCFSQNAWYFLS